jgi:tRNA modification GTPase
MSLSEGRLIVAVATGHGPSAIGILRLSGFGALEVARRRLAGLPEAPAPRQLYRCALLDEVGQTLDDVLAVHFPAPRSYTGEEVVEVQGHGGIALMAAAERSLLAAGAAAATAGEFTRRAVTNGRLDLLEAEALAAVLEADEEESLDLARAAWSTGSKPLKDLLRVGRSALAEVRGSHDHPIETKGEVLGWAAASEALAARCEALAHGPALEGRMLEGLRIVLLGPPNAGKSSLLNALLGEERALVHPEPGTTRDLLTAPHRLAGRRVSLCDTAGVRQAEGLEGAGIARALEAARGADLVVWVEDISVEPFDPPAGLRIDLRVLAKCDLTPSPQRPAGGGSAIWVSAHTGHGLIDLEQELSRRVGPQREAVSRRQQRWLLRAAGCFRRAGGAGPEDLRAASLEDGVEALEALCGEGPSQRLEADEIFSRFCIGK